MANVEIPFPLSSSPGLRPQDGSGRLINVYAEPRGEDLGAVWRRVPGLDTFAANAGASGFRGAIQVGTTVYAAWAGELYSFNSSGTVTTIGTFAGTGRVFWARNNAVIPDVVAVTGSNAFSVTGAGAVSFADTDVGSPQCVCAHTGYFMFGYGNGDIQASGLNAVTINTLDKARAESNPDGVDRLWSYNGYLWVAGKQSIEVWGGTPNPTGFPLNRVNYNITPGLMSADAVAGFEQEFGHPVIYVGSDSSVRQINGYSSEKISPPWLDRLIEDLADKDELSASVFIASGHPFWQLSSDSWTATFDLNNGKWHERQSHNETRSRIVRSFPAFDKWLCGDTDNGDIKEIAASSAGEDMGGFNTSIVSGVTIDAPNWGGITIRNRIAGSLFEVTGDTMTITFCAGDNKPFFIAEAFIDYAGTEGSFESSSPTPITWSGINDVLIPLSSTVTSDEISLSIDGTKDIVISMYISDTSYDDTLKQNVVDGWTLYYQTADDAETQSATVGGGYTTFSTIPVGISRIDVVPNVTSEPNPLIARIESGPSEAFPNRARVNRADFRFATGVGIVTGEDPSQTNPKVMISYSDDGGVSWSNPYERNLGRQAHAEQRVSVFNAGIAGPLGRRWRLDVSDGVDVSFMGGTMDVGLLNS